MYCEWRQFHGFRWKCTETTICEDLQIHAVVTVINVFDGFMLLICPARFSSDLDDNTNVEIVLFFLVLILQFFSVIYASVFDFIRLCIAPLNVQSFQFASSKFHMYRRVEMQKSFSSVVMTTRSGSCGVGLLAKSWTCLLMWVCWVDPIF